jgi:YbbR domain-containing protein
LQQRIPPYLQAAELTERVAVALTGREISIRGINPSFIDLSVENRTAHKIPIVLMDSLDFEVEYFLKDSIRFTPDSVSVFGPASIIDKYENWETEVLYIKSINGNIQRAVSLKPSVYPQVDLMPDTVQVTIEVDRYSERRITVPIQIKNAKDSIKIIPQEVELYVVVGLADFEKLNKKDFVVEIDMKNVTPNSRYNSLPIIISKQPSFVKAIRFYDKTVDYFILK